MFARFKENNGFQQTRGFIRLTRLMVRSLFENDGAKAKKKTLINAYDYNLNDTTTYSQITNIKPKMSNGTKNPKKLLKRALNVAKRRCGHSGRTNPQMMPATIAMTTLVSSPILIFFISY